MQSYASKFRSVCRIASLDFGEFFVVFKLLGGGFSVGEYRFYLKKRIRSVFPGLDFCLPCVEHNMKRTPSGIYHIRK